MALGVSVLRIMPVVSLLSAVLTTQATIFLIRSEEMVALLEVGTGGKDSKEATAIVDNMTTQ
jgi:hypothetical protein